MIRQSRGFTCALAALATLAAGAGAAATATAATTKPVIHVVSNRADLISGGDALVTIDLPSKAAAANAKVSLNGTDITQAFGLRQNGLLPGSALTVLGVWTRSEPSP
jgi:hypothetical protein